jgi:hypothetical protein
VTAPTTGQRLRCGVCGTEIIVVKAPTGPIACCGKTMEPREG